MKPAGPIVQPPPAGVRLESLWVRLDQALLRLDGAVRRWLPEEWNPLAQSGRATNFALAVAVVTGILMLFWYSPSLSQAHASMEAIQGRTLGGWMRAMHRYSSDLAMLLVVVHAVRTLVARKFSGPRWLPWVSGVLMLALVWFIGWTGYWLVWDQPAQQVAVTSMRVLDALPIFGEPMSRLFVADRLVPSLLFFVVFFLHMLLPLLIAVGLVFHLARLTRVRLLPGRGLCIAMVVALGVASLVVPAPLDAPAQMGVKAEHLTVDAWYLTPLALGLRLQEGGLWLAFGLLFAVGMAVPWLLGRRARMVCAEAPAGPALETPGAPGLTAIQTVVRESRCHACTQCVQDCPFGAITMLPRTDGKAFPARAWVDPARCVGCAVCVGSCDSEAMNLPWFDLTLQEGAIEGALGAAQAGGAPVTVALVAADCTGGMAHFDPAAWSRRLPDCLVRPVPTASWVRPRLVEKLLAAGAAGVVIVRASHVEAAARDANQWVSDRLARTREPHFRPQRAGANAAAWRVVDDNPADPEGLARSVAELRRAATPAGHLPRAASVRGVFAGALLAVALVAAVVAPSHLRVTNPAPSDPELVFAFKAFGDRESIAELDAEADAQRPVHMRGRVTAKPRRVAVTVSLSINGEVQERSFGAKGISRDGPAIDSWRLPLQPGNHDIAIELRTGPDSEPLRWQQRLTAVERHLLVVTYDPAAGFRLE